MSNAIITNSTLEDIADAIRAKGGASGTMLPSEMPGNIRNISSGGGGEYQQKTVHPSLTQQTVSPDLGYDALSAVTVEAMELQTKSATPSETAQTIEADTGKDGLSSVTVEAAPLQEKNATLAASSQEITADSGYYGLSKVTVPASPSFTTQEKSVAPSTSAQNITPDSGYDGLSKVVVGAATLQAKTATLEASAHDVTADNGYYGLSKVTVPAAPKLITKSITENGAYLAEDDSADGYSEVTVSVGGGGVGIDFLWENPSPSSSFAAQTVEIDLTDYDAIILQGKYSPSLPGAWPGFPPSGIHNCNQAFIEKNNKTGRVLFGGNSGMYMWREVTVSDSGVKFSTGYESTGRNPNVTYGIPYRIYGVKGTLPTA